MKFGHLIEFKMMDTFLKKSSTKDGEETIPNDFLKNQN